MKWRKEIVAHDELCTFDPCICTELDFLRSRKASEKAVKDMENRIELAQKALDGEN
jgi:hypothetical protein